jgi:hypothetical protein
MLLVVTPGLEVGFGYGTFWDGSASTVEASTPSHSGFLGGTI